jgi:CheY-like chemotaxis protein
VPGTQHSGVDTVAPGQPCPATIVVVDDEPEVRVVVSEFLEDFGYRVLQADGAAAALRLLEQSPNARLMISDIRMPDMSGLELADIVTSRYPELKVILISGYFVAQQVSRRFLRKPFRMNELRAAVEQELDIG